LERKGDGDMKPKTLRGVYDYLEQRIKDCPNNPTVYKEIRNLLAPLIDLNTEVETCLAQIENGITTIQTPWLVGEFPGPYFGPTGKDFRLLADAMDEIGVGPPKPDFNKREPNGIVKLEKGGVVEFDEYEAVKYEAAEYEETKKC
jgi:hypothetical protein